MARPAAIRRLAQRAGILPGFVDVAGKRRTPSDATRVALLAAMGLDASTEAAARRTLETLDRAARDEWLAPVRVVRPVHRGGARVAVRAPDGHRGPVSYHLELEREDGRRLRAEGRLRGSRGRWVIVRLPEDPGPGHHVVRLTLDADGGTRVAEQVLIVTPGACPAVREVVGRRGLFGVWANLYAVRSARNWGAGDLSDLGALVHWAGSVGAAFVGINPLHALRNTPPAVSPYSPVSRLFRNPLYLDITAVPEFPACAEAAALVGAPSHRAAVAALRAGTAIDYAQVMALKRPVLEALYREFAARGHGSTEPRAVAHARFLASGGELLADFATFLALDEHFAATTGARDWREWPTAYRRPRGAAAAAFRRDHPDAIGFHCWVQFELDRQLGAAASAARLRIGLYGDLAVGSDPAGFDPWRFADVFVAGAHIGAPPDDYAPRGQDWGLPPLNPLRLAASGYAYWRALLRHTVAHHGAVRIDHVMGLFRQYWVPEGRPASDGAYVRFPAEDLLGILALETARRGVVVIGEDLGTVPRGLPAILRRWGILSSRVLYFERDRRGAFRPASRYSGRALVTVHTHDHIPLAGFWQGRDFTLRHELGLLSDRGLATALERRGRDRAALLRRLRAERLIGRGQAPEGPALATAVHGFLARAPAPLVAASLDDLTGETDPINLPDVDPARFASWSRRQRVPIDALPHDPGVNLVVGALAARRVPQRR